MVKTVRLTVRTGGLEILRIPYSNSVRRVKLYLLG